MFVRGGKRGGLVKGGARFEDGPVTRNTQLVNAPLMRWRWTQEGSVTWSQSWMCRRCSSWRVRAARASGSRDLSYDVFFFLEGRNKMV